MKLKTLLDIIMYLAFNNEKLSNKNKLYKLKYNFENFIRMCKNLLLSKFIQNTGLLIPTFGLIIKRKILNDFLEITQS